MARPAFAGRRARSRSGQLAAFGAVVMLVSAALAVLGGAVSPVLESGSRTLVQQSGAAAATLRIIAPLASDAVSQDAAVRELTATALRDVAADVVRSVSASTSVTVDGAEARVLLLVDPGVTEAADLVAGAWPSGAAETAVTDAAAARLGIAPGAVLTLPDGRELTVTGVWHPRDAAAARWFDDPSIGSGAAGDAAGPLLVDASVLTDRSDATMLRDVMAHWSIIPAADGLGPAGLPALADAIARLDTELRRSGGGSASLTGDLAATVARATEVSAVAAGVLGLPLVLVALAGAIVLGLIARAIAAGRGPEFVLLRARGASARALTGAAARESLAVAALGAAAGGGAAVGVLRLGLPLLGIRAEEGVLVPVLVAAGVAVAAAVLATIVTVVELRAPVTGRAESGRAAVLAALGPLLLVLVSAGLALAQFLSLGSPVVVRADGIVRTDPLALTAPVLVLLAGALVAPVIAGPVVAVAERFARGSRGILPVLPLRQLSRRARAVAAAVLVMALAAGAVVLAGVFHVRGDEARVAAERTATGADLRLELPVRTTIDPGRPGAGATLLDGVPEVADAFPVLSGVASIGADAVPLLAGDVAAFAALPGVAPELSAAASGLSAGRPGAPLPAGTTSLSVRVELTPGVGIPDGLELGVGAWLADEHGGALRVELGIAPVAPGVVELTGDIPPAAEMLAIEFRPPALPPSTVIDLALDEVATGSGDHIAFDGATTTLTSESADVQRLLPQLRTEQPLPVVISTTLADRLGVAAGSDFTMRLNGVSAPLPLRVLAVVPRLPGMAQGPGILLDLQALEARAVALDGSVPAANQLWVTASDPDAAAPQIRAVLTQRARIVTPRTSSPAPLLEPALVLIETGVGVTVLLAILGFVAVASSIGQRRRAELAPLRSLGLSVARIRGARIIELAATAVIAVLLGGLAGLLTAALVVPGLVGVLT